MLRWWCDLSSPCSLEELFLCLNDYETVSCSPVCCQSLKLLHITDNNLQDWTEIRKLGIMFPSLDTLILANNNLTTIEESEDSLARLFPNLRSINLHKSGERPEAMHFLWWLLIRMFPPEKVKNTLGAAWNLSLRVGCFLGCISSSKLQSAVSPAKKAAEDSRSLNLLDGSGAVAEMMATYLWPSLSCHLTWGTLTWGMQC